MKKVILFAAVAVAMLGMAALQPAMAACGSPRTFSSIASATAYSYIYTPGYPFPNGRSTSDNVEGLFWSFSGGDPALGVGNDSGLLDGAALAPDGYAAWLYPGGTGAYLYPTAIYSYNGYSNWADGRIDGCIDLDGSDGALVDPDQCMVVLLTDEVGGVGYFALIAQSPTGTGNYLLN